MSPDFVTTWEPRALAALHIVTAFLFLLLAVAGDFSLDSRRRR